MSSAENIWRVSTHGALQIVLLSVLKPIHAKQHQILHHGLPDNGLLADLRLLYLIPDFTMSGRYAERFPNTKSRLDSIFPHYLDNSIRLFPAEKDIRIYCVKNVDVLTPQKLLTYPVLHNKC